ncbi:uncharacterized protein LOC143606427 [Bidens hawaiensis]|uniref:uncharacterized protein LOC143606427 n=1 Tax=Bidens hawaiensis TaxID=980011 RepID=UPI0040497563
MDMWKLELVSRAGWNCGGRGVEMLTSIMPRVSLRPREDKVVWIGDEVGGFLVRNAYFEPEFVFEWNRLVPRKVSFVAWRAALSRLPTRDALIKRNIPVSSILCSIFGDLEESVEHIFISCGFAQLLWSVISLWCKVPSFLLFSFRDLLELHKFSELSKDKATVFQAVCLIAMWCLWKKRNALVHDGVPIYLSGLME